MAVVIAAGVALSGPARAQTAVIDFSPNSAAPRETVTFEVVRTCQSETGTPGFELHWDNPAGITYATLRPDGVFEGEFDVPLTAPPGTHLLSAVCLSDGAAYDVDVKFHVNSPSPSAPELRAEPRTGRAGRDLRVIGTGHDGCDPAYAPAVRILEIVLVKVDPLDDDIVLVKVDALDAGAFDVPATLPDDLVLGPHVLTSRCSVGDQIRTMAQTTIEVTTTSLTESPSPSESGSPSPSESGSPSPSESGSPSPSESGSPSPSESVPVGSGGRNRSEFPESLSRVGDISFSPSVVLRNVGIAMLLMLLVGFPAELFNKTVEEHYDELSRWFGWRGRHAPHRQWPAMVTLPLFAAFAALLYALLDPHLTYDRASLALVIGLFLAILIIIAAFELPAAAYARTRVGGSARWRVYPKALAFAALCVAVSRLASFRPGYVYGIVAGYVLAQVGRSTTADAGRSVAFGSVTLLGLSVLAWVAWIPIDRLAAPGTASLAVLIVDALLAAVFVAGVEGLAFGLVPVRFLDGQALARWSRPVWIALWGAAMFGFVHVLLDPAVGRLDRDEPAAIVVMIVLFVSFGAASVALWAYFRFRRSVERVGPPHRTR